MDYMLELATALVRHVRAGRPDSAHAPTPALEKVRREWRQALLNLSRTHPSPDVPAEAAVTPREPELPVEVPQTEEPNAELWERAPDVLAVEVLADVLSRHADLVAGALKESGLGVYPMFLDYLLQATAEFFSPARRPWKRISANEHWNLLADRREKVAKILITTDSWKKVPPERKRGGAQTDKVAPTGGSDGGITASVLGTGDITERARQFGKQCAETAEKVKAKVGWSTEDWHAVGRAMRRPELSDLFLEALRSELLGKPDLVRALTEATAVAVPFTTAFAAELDEIGNSRQARRAPQPGTARHPLRKAAAMNLVGLALSGGGVRSATFNLGVLQALAHLGLLSRIDYLSTVSGGGYIGAWLTSWSKRLRESGGRGIVAVESRLRDEPVTEPDAPRMRALRFLREYSNYLSPQTGFFSADTWTMVAIWLRNTLLNQAVLVLTLCAILAVPWMLWFLQYKLTEPAALGAPACGAGLLARAPVLVTGMAMLLLYPAAVSGYQLRRFWLPPSERHRLAGEMLGQQGVLFEIVTPLVIAAALLSSALFDAVGCAPDPAFRTAAFRQLALIFAGVCTVVAVGGSYAKCFLVDRISITLSQWTRLILGTWAVTIIAVAIAASSAAGAAAIVILHANVSTATPNSLAFVAFGPPVILGIFALMIVVKIGILGRNLFDEHREWWSRVGAWLAIVSLTWLGICAVSLYSPRLAEYARDAVGRISLSLGGLVWAVWTAAGVLLGKAPESDGQTQVAGRRLQTWVIALAPYIFVVGLVMLVALATFETVTSVSATEFDLAHIHATHQFSGDHWHWLLGLPPGLLLVAFVLSWRVDVNEFSMHHFYKNRIVRSYLGASRDSRMSSSDRAPDPFTGFDSGDDLKVAYLRYTPGGEQHARNARRTDNREDVRRYVGPIPIVNTALNLVKGDDLAWQERKAQSFAFTPFFSGYDYRHRGVLAKRHAPYGFRPTALYGYPPFGIGLGTAVAISGAAASPSMGHHSSPPAAFLMTMFNARLGWWIGNPRDKHNWLRSSPRRGLLYLLNELFSLTNDRTHFVNLSDGGHFENLGIYELVRRRCRYIIACDAEQDHALTFSGLGNAIRKCRIDFGAEISVRATRIRPPDVRSSSALHCVVGDITYADGERGTLLYLKASVTGDEPADVLEYRSREPAFPHHSTLGDQFFDESQFESYRKLGFHVAHTALAHPTRSAQSTLGVAGLPPLDVLFQHLREYWHPPTNALDAHRREHSERYDALLKRILDQPDPDIDAAFFSPPATTKPERYRVFMGTFMLELMQRVVLDLELDTDGDNPHNAGWLTIFRRWKGQAAVDAAWNATHETYSRRFRSFYESL